MTRELTSTDNKKTKYSFHSIDFYKKRQGIVSNSVTDHVLENQKVE